MRIDAIVIGGSFAGLSAAMYIARARRSVAILDSGLPRNRFAAHAHGFFGQDGTAPREMLATARAQVAAYPTTRFIEEAAAGAEATGDGFAVRLAGGEVLEAGRLVLAFGISDELPEIPGLAERWGKSVIHCPYCHGYEFADRQLGVLNTSPMSVHGAALGAEWGATTYYLNGGPEPDPATMADLARRGVKIEPRPVRALHGKGEELAAIEFDDGSSAAVEALYVSPRAHLNSNIGAELGCAYDDAYFGPILRTDELQATTVPGVFAAGDIARWPDHRSGQSIRVEHWVVAERQGEVAARNILGKGEVFSFAAPFFWSQHYDVVINYTGHAEQWDRIEVDGDPAAHDCTVSYWLRGRRLAVATVGRDLDNLRSEVALEEESAT